MKENAHSSQYLLMNKDVCILHFSCAHNEFGEVLFAEEEWLVQYRPIGYHGLQSFLEQRRAPKHRAHIRELLEQCGCSDMEGFLRVTHALSLNDTFGVKGTDSPPPGRPDFAGTKRSGMHVPLFFPLQADALAEALLK